jgi:hypothetical protein
LEYDGKTGAFKKVFAQGCERILGEWVGLCEPLGLVFGPELLSFA